MEIADQEVLLSNGDRVMLHSLADGGRVALVFLRHFGCTFCMEYVGELAQHPDLNVVFVSLGDRLESDEFQRKMKSPHRFISDPGATLYKAFGLGRGKVAQMFGPRMFVRGAQAVMKGHGVVGRPVGDPWQMPGVFVLEPGGTVVWEYRSKDAADNPEIPVLRAALAGA